MSRDGPQTGGPERKRRHYADELQRHAQVLKTSGGSVIRLYVSGEDDGIVSPSLTHR